MNATTISAQIAKAPIGIDSVRFMAFNRSNRPAPERPGCRAWRIDTGQWVRVRGRGWGCHRDECRQAQAAYQRSYRDRRANGEIRPSSVAELQPGRVEEAVEAELGGLAGRKPEHPATGIAPLRRRCIVRRSSAAPTISK